MGLWFGPMMSAVDSDQLNAFEELQSNFMEQNSVQVNFSVLRQHYLCFKLLILSRMNGWQCFEINPRPSIAFNVKSSCFNSLVLFNTTFKVSFII